MRRVKQIFEHKKIILHYWLFIHSGLISLYFRTQFVCVCVLCLYKDDVPHSLIVHYTILSTALQRGPLSMSYFLPHPSHFFRLVKNRFTDVRKEANSNTHYNCLVHPPAIKFYQTYVFGGHEKVIDYSHMDSFFKYN